MSAEHDRFADWDAAYLLGALPPSERRLFEEHLAQCRTCRAAVAEIAPTLGLLARVAPDRAESMLAEQGTGVERVAKGPGPGDAGRDRLIRTARSSARSHDGWWVGALAAVAAVVVAAVVGVATWIVPPAVPGAVIALQPLVDAPLAATVQLSAVPWGTSIDMSCRYGPDLDDPADDIAAGGEGWPYALVLTSVDGTTSEVSSWRAFPGATAHLSAGTALDTDEIATVEIRASGSGKVLMRADLDGPG